MRDDPAWHREHLHGLPCRVLLPEQDDQQGTSGRWPLVVWLHGSGERGTDNEAQLRNGITSFAERAFRECFPCIVVAPQCPRGETFGGRRYGGESETQRAVVALVRDLAHRRTVDADRIYGIGFSMGAIGLWDILLRHRGLFAAAIPLAGDVDVEQARSLAAFPLWAVHGRHDTVVPPDAARAFGAHVARVGGVARSTEVHDAGHDVWRFAFGFRPLWQWLFAQRRAPQDTTA